MFVVLTEKGVTMDEGQPVESESPPWMFHLSLVMCGWVGVLVLTGLVGEFNAGRYTLRMIPVTCVAIGGVLLAVLGVVLWIRRYAMARDKQDSE